MIALVCDLKYGEFIHTLGEAHIYINHIDQVNEQLSRKPKKLPKIKINPSVKNIFNFKYKAFSLEEYDPYPLIKAPVAV
jgi:thymidylate synthase